MISVYASWASVCCALENMSEEQGLQDCEKIAREHFLNVCKESGNMNIGSNITKELSNFVSGMEKAFLEKLESKYFGLTFFLGTLEGISDSHAQLPLSIMHLISNFLLQYCGPIQSATIITDRSDMNIYSSYDGADLEKIRDTALSAVATMLRIPISNIDDSTFGGIIQYRMTLAKKAVQLRCASIEDCKEDDDEDDDDDEFSRTKMMEEETNTLSGLSLLPRAKRSLCFRTLDAVLSGITEDGLQFSDHSISVDVAYNINSFASFTATTLHGETDPRCLVQLLKILKKAQEVLAPLAYDQLTFPFTDIFDACAVYYPVRFSPPPNDPHGITREVISTALLDVFTCSSNIHKGLFNRKQSGTKPDISMLNLAAGLFLERIFPLVDNDAFGDDEAHILSTTLDRIDAIRDLKCLLHITSEDSSSITNVNSALYLISNDVTQHLSQTILKCHEEAATKAVVSTNITDSTENKKLADACRNLVMRFAYDLEIFETGADRSTIGNRYSLWNTFVKDTVQLLSNTIASAPQSLKGRMSIAYLASLSACGGERTVRFCIESCLPVLIDVMSEALKSDASNHDVEKISTAAYGVSTLFSSCRLSMEQLRMDGVNVSPHPLEKYAKQIMQYLCQLINHGATFDCSQELERNEIDIAAVKSLESVLQSTPAFLLDSEISDVVTELIVNLSNILLSVNIADENQDFLSACSRLVGSAIGKALLRAERRNDTVQTILETNERLKAYVHQELLPKILLLCLKETIMGSHALYAIGYACETDQDSASSTIVSQIYNSLLMKIKSPTLSDFNEIVSLFKVLAYVIRVGGPGVIDAFHILSASEDGDILHHLALIPNYKSKDDEAMEGMSNLLLPETREHYRSEAQKVIALANDVIPYIIKAYYLNVPKPKIRNITLRIANVLPPLSDADEAELTVYVPVLGAILSSVEESTFDEITEVLLQLVPGLCDFILNSDHNPQARSAAGSCVYSIISRFQTDQMNCNGLAIMRDTLIPQILTKIENCNHPNPDECIRDIEDSFNLFACIGCASACRGGVSSKTADEIARFFVLVACRGAVCAPALGIKTPFDFIGDRSAEFCCRVSHSAASALGSIFNVKDGNPFARQRLANMVLPVILSSSEDHNEDNLLTGVLLCAANVVCCVPFSALGQDKLSEFSELFVSGLLKCAKAICDQKHTDPQNETVILILAAILRIYEGFPEILRPHLSNLFPVVLLLCISSVKPRESMINILTLQLLQNFSRSKDDSTNQFCIAYKDAVIRNLAKTLDHPSAQVRHAAMLVRNTWCVMGV